MRITPIAAFAILTAACGGEAATEPEPPQPQLSIDALSYLNEALDAMESRSINRHRIDWPTFHADVVRRAGAAQSYRETYPAIRYAIDGLGDNHSYFVEPQSVSPSVAAAPPSSPIRAERVRDRLAYLRVPGFLGTDDVEFAMALQGRIRDLDTAETCGWIVDLRWNGGGNMWPMLLGVGPLVGSGTVGYFVDPDSIWSPWLHDDGQVGQSVLGLGIPDPYALTRPDPPIAVLTERATASSGEAIATAFRGRPDTRSFGAATAGLSTGITGIRLRDGAQIGLAASLFADRTRSMYGGVIPPDQPVEGERLQDPNAGDTVVDAAADWLLAHPRCG